MCGQYGDIMLVHGDNLLSEAIQNLTQSFFSHAVLCTKPGKIAEMTRFGFQYRDNHYLDGIRPYIVLRHRLLFPGSHKAHSYVAKMESCISGFIKDPPRYDFFEILNQALALLVHRRDRLIINGDDYISFNMLLSAGERLICSALVDTVYEAAGIDLFPGRVPRHTTPADIYNLSLQNPSPLVEIYRSPGLKKTMGSAEPSPVNHLFKKSDSLKAQKLPLPVQAASKSSKAAVMG